MFSNNLHQKTLLSSGILCSLDWLGVGEISVSDGTFGSFIWAESFGSVHLIEPALSAPKMALLTLNRIGQNLQNNIFPWKEKDAYT